MKRIIGSGIALSAVLALLTALSLHAPQQHAAGLSTPQTSAPEAQIATQAAPAVPVEKIVHTPKNTSFTFDVDGVIVEAHTPIKTILWNHKWDIVKAIIFHPIISWQTYKLMRQDVPYFYYHEFFKVNNMPGLVSIMEDILYQSEPIAGTVDIINELYKKGYKLHIATNQPEEDFNHYRQKFPEIFGKFAPIKMVDFELGKPFIAKPDPLYFKALKEQITQAGDWFETNIFIDDRKANVDSSLTEGFVGLHFLSPEDCHQKLAEMGILEPKAPAEPAPATPVAQVADSCCCCDHACSAEQACPSTAQTPA